MKRKLKHRVGGGVLSVPALIEAKTKERVTGDILRELGRSKAEGTTPV